MPNCGKSTDKPKSKPSPKENTMAALTPEQTAELDKIAALKTSIADYPDEMDGLDLRQYKRQVESTADHLRNHLTALFKLAS